ncbi:MAG: zinc-dependent metalloprotease family protein [Cyanobacteria bacterium P01_F01_bin.3]
MIHSTYFQRVLRPVMAAGCVAVLSSCTDGVPQSVRTLYFDETTNGELFVQPIQVCNDNGQNCAGVNLFEDITAKILEQARLTVNFLPTNQLNASRFLAIDSGESEFYELSRAGSAGAFGRHRDSTRTSGPLNVWFVDEFKTESGLTQFGSAWVDANGIIISSATLDFNRGQGRPDTLAHEIGHNLGLRHTNLGAGGPNNLLTDGNNRNVPGSVDDIYPHGAGLSQLTPAQLQAIVDSPFTSYTVSAEADANAASDAASYSGSEAISADAASFEEAAVDLASISLTSLQVPSGAPEASRIPEPSSWVAIAFTGFSALLFFQNRRTCSA